MKAVNFVMGGIMLQSETNRVINHCRVFECLIVPDKHCL